MKVSTCTTPTLINENTRRYFVAQMPFQLLTETRKYLHKCTDYTGTQHYLYVHVYVYVSCTYLRIGAINQICLYSLVYGVCHVLCMCVFQLLMKYECRPKTNAH